jgi:DUF2892 family protein
MKRNMGNTDRMVRMLIAFLIIILFLTNVIEGTLGIALLFLAGIFILTTLIGFCPLYTIVGINTGRKGNSVDNIRINS